MSHANTAREKGCVLFESEKGYWSWMFDGKRVVSDGLFLYWPNEEEAAKAFLNWHGGEDN